MADLDALLDELTAGDDGFADADGLYAAFGQWAADQGTPLYPHQDEAVMELLGGSHVILSTPTGSGKSLVATAAHFQALAQDRVSFYTAPIKALVSEKFFALCRLFGADNVGMVTGDASVNADAPIICCTAEILANIALREGADADVGLVVMDEFHFYSEPDRGWAWQVPLLLLNRAQFLLMSATLGDVGAIGDDLVARTGREVAVVADAPRPVPLSFAWAMTPLPETITELLETHQAPVYIVHFTQKEAIERAQSLTSVRMLSRAERDQVAARIGDFRFTAGFGKTLSGLVRSGIGVHHAGMLPRYRRLVEQLAQDGLLRVVCGTDTLGVGINVPIRTVLFTGLAKFDGSRQRVLRVREFQQIAGRAGRAGYDTSGYVVVQAPEHVIANERALAKIGDDPKKRRSYARKKPPEGFVGWTEETFRKLVDGRPEPLAPRMRIDHSIILNTVARPGDPVAHLSALVRDNHDRPAAQTRLARRAITLSRSLLDTGVLRRLEEPAPDGRTVDLAPEVADNFALNQPLAPFALAAVELLDSADPAYALDVVSVVEAVLEDPRPVLFAQRSKAKGEAVAQMKADGVEYEQRMVLLDDVSWPQPLSELLEAALEVYRSSHPWVGQDALSPKAVVRDMFERAMSFTEFVGYYQLTRSEGVLLRYLSDAYRTLRQTVPADAVDEGLADLLDWLGETIRQTDSSLLEEWEALTHPASVATSPGAPQPTPESVRPVTGNERAFRVMVRNAMFRRVELAARDQWRGLHELDVSVAGLVQPPRQPVLSLQDWDDALGAYFADHDEIGTDADARGPALLTVEATQAPPPGLAPTPDQSEGSAVPVWNVRQTLADPAGDHDWVVEARCDLPASDEIGEPMLLVTALRRLGG
jgi:hypothetical protein